jgi:small conductance mechanosensitive channel
MMEETAVTFWEKVSKFVSDVLLANVPRIIVALIILWIGFKLIKWLMKVLTKVFNKRNVDPSLQSFLKPVISISLKILLVLTIMGMIGIQATSFIAALGAAGLAVGMALQGTLQNFAGGVIILLLKPFKVGDYIEQGSYSGTVKSIKIFSTILVTPDNKIVIIPNSQLATNSLINYTEAGERRVDISVGIAYGQSVDKATGVLMELAKSHKCVLQDPAPIVAVIALADSSVNLQLRVWTKTDDYWTVNFDLNKSVYQSFNENGIEIPFNQLEVHVKNN